MKQMVTPWALSTQNKIMLSTINYAKSFVCGGFAALVDVTCKKVSKQGAIAFFYLLMLMPANNIYAQLPPNFVSTKVQDGYNEPMGVVFSSSGNLMFVWDRIGHVYVSKWDGNSYVRQSASVVNLIDEIGYWGDFGLMSICLDPDFDQNGLIYLYYIVDRHHLLYFGTPQYNTAIDEYFNATIGRVTRYQLNLTAPVILADVASRKILIGETKNTGIPLTYKSHMGGTLVFGRDNTLLLSTGDGASFSGTDSGSLSGSYYLQALADSILRPEENVGAFRAQMINSHSGKILRFDPATGNGITSNPFYDVLNPRSPQSRVWAMGCRNPFRISIQPNTASTDPEAADPGTIFICDVGYNLWEELNIVKTGGLNLGWPLYEGETTNSGYTPLNKINPDEGQPFKNLCIQPTSFTTDTVAANRRFTHYRPAIAWKHGVVDARVPWFSGNTSTDPGIGTPGAPVSGAAFRGSCSIGGIYYTGDAFGAAYHNTYFFADFTQNWVKVANSTAQQPLINEVSDFAPEGFTKGIVYMAQNPLDNAIYYVNINTGEVRKIFHTTTNLPPSVSITNPFAPAIFNAGASIQARVNASDPDGNVAKVELFVNGAKLGEDLTNPFIFYGSKVEAGVYKIVARATDDSNAVALSDTLTITVTACTGAGTIYGEGYTDITGSQVADLTANSAYPNSPSVTAQLNLLEYSSLGDNYGARLRGYICAPLSGNYTFYIAGDDQAGLFLSTDENPANKTLIAYNERPVAPRAWTTYPTQTSAPVSLVKGARYYLETLHKQSTGLNHMSVGWTLPNGITERPVPGSRLSPFISSPSSAHRGIVDFATSMRGTANLPQFSVIVQPNPSINDFTLVVNGNSSEIIGIKITDASGRIIEKISATSLQANNLKFGKKFLPGVYFVEMVQGKQSKIIKLIKQ
jgi:glucose/arabinose dehydrogenase